MRTAPRTLDPPLIAPARLGIAQTSDDLTRRPQLRPLGEGRHGSSASTGAISTTPNVHHPQRELDASPPSRPSHSGTPPTATAHTSPHTTASGNRAPGS